MSILETQSNDINQCACGCKQTPSLGKKFIWGHNKANWKGGRIKINGYWAIHKPEHHFADKHGYVFEHRLIYEQYYNCILLPWVIIHHINGIITDNRIENLVALSRAEHLRIHQTKDMSERFCYLCNYTDKEGKRKWYGNDGEGYYCHKCYMITYNSKFI